MTRNIVSVDGKATGRDMRGSQMALELRKFFDPQRSDKTAVDTAFNDSLNDDGALDAYAESIVWRLRGVHAMVSLVDRGTQYFIAGAVRTGQVDTDEEVITTGEWFGCQTVPTPGGLCENTLALDLSKEEYSCFIVNDLSKDPRFAQLPVVDGQIASYRFYAGAPITTSHGVNIGSLFFFDDKPRDGLPRNQRRFMHLQASNVMKHLETKREAAERRRAALMSNGIARFLERTSRSSYLGSDEHFDLAEKRSNGIHKGEEGEMQQAQNGAQRKPSVEKESVLDKIRTALDHAADILRESLELTAGGVLFLDPTIGYIENDNVNTEDSISDLGAERTYRDEKSRQRSNESHIRPSISQNSARHLSVGAIRSSTDKYKASKILAMSCGEQAPSDSHSETLDSKTLQSLIKSYPQGNVWYLDEEGYFSSLEQVRAWDQRNGISPSGRVRSTSPINISKRQEEAAILSRIFPGARQIVFLPLWDVGADQYYAGCFIWSESPVPVFTVDSELAYLSAFTNSLMVEISRLDALTSNKMKSDFISSISHEFRSPLHGILASAEFLRESELNASQMEFISTIQNCSSTLLDTINHVLDYSKINSFERAGQHQDTISNELYQDTNVALLCEDIVNGMIAANEFRNTSSNDPLLPNSGELISRHDQRAHRLRHSEIEVIIDIEKRDWDFRVQAGALRRVVMNIFGNAQKYTQSGYIMLQLGINESHNDGTGKTFNYLSLHIRDTGKGMSSEYMERKLYHPFAQEDTFATGVGLGLSIVWSIVNQLGGKISIRSELGKGTDVEVTIPVEKPDNFQHVNGTFNHPLDAEPQQCISNLRHRATGKSIHFLRDNGTGPISHVSWSCIERYCTEWFGFVVKDASADLIIADRENATKYNDGQRILIIHEDMACSTKTEDVHHSYAIGKICSPVGPFKLARSLLALLDQKISLPPVAQNYVNQMDAGTQTPLGSPQERTIMNGIILTDYGFTPPSLPPGSSHVVTEDPKPSPLAARNAQQYRPANQAFASIATMSIHPPSQPSSTTSLPSPTFPPSRLPIMKLTLPTPKIITPPPDPVAKSTSRSLHILAVDDNALNLQLLHRYLLKRQGDAIVTARNGIEAVEAVKSLGKKIGFDVIFMDISMPEMDGFEATRLIRSYENTQFVQHDETNEVFEEKWGSEGVREKRSGAYIVALTGLASRRDRDLAQECGFDDFFTKPISFKRIGEMLRGLSEKGV
ncbi:hypothetical protein L207DRAFT_90676 [Hyaloscypha variabilis F]|uniref:Uncharacterized protein n=1 Tax=Hyaloscypha variabilis (strain UAMH 11265 / GT02V1 / F) TaxID=1149755 RepID=A0A2J6REC7_HYAVF|nr:hypothetical protein L207DRAFT_90676 [Hyaloscypha variabilis F]